jgi:hypothetical protein
MVGVVVVVAVVGERGSVGDKVNGGIFDSDSMGGTGPIDSRDGDS